MPNFRIKSRIAGMTFEFSCPGNYVYVSIGGVTPQQICARGSLMGSTISCYIEDQEAFESICRGWYRQHMRKFRDYYS